MLRRKAVSIGLIIAALTIFAGCAHTKQLKAPQKDAPIPDKPYLLMVYARQAEANENYAKAEELYSRVNDPYAWLGLARINFYRGNNKKALELLDKVLADKTYTNDALELRTNVYAKEGKWAKATEDIEALQKKQPDNEQLTIFLANLKLMKSDFKGAKKVIETAMKKSSDPVLYYMLSKACMGLEDRACARDALETGIEEKPDFAPLYIELGRLYELDGEMNLAEEIYQKYIFINPSSVETHLALADLYVSQGRTKEAIEELKTLMQKSPEREILERLAIIEIQEHMYEDVINLFKDNKIISDNERYLAAVAYAGLKEWNNALNCINAITSDDKQGCEVALLKANILEDKGDAAASLETLQKAWKKYSDEVYCREIGYKLSSALESALKRDDAISIALGILKQDPKDPYMLNFVGYIWADTGQNLAKAEEMIRQALTQRPDDPFILDSMGWVMFKEGKLKEAGACLEKSIEQIGDDATINAHMGEIQMSLGNEAKALDYFIKASLYSKKPEKELQDKIKNLQDKLKAKEKDKDKK